MTVLALSWMEGGYGPSGPAAYQLGRQEQWLAHGYQRSARWRVTAAVILRWPGRPVQCSNNGAFDRLRNALQDSYEAVTGNPAGRGSIATARFFIEVAAVETASWVFLPVENRIRRRQLPRLALFFTPWRVPTSATYAVLDTEIQYWTPSAVSAVADLNYRAASGFGSGLTGIG